MHTNQVQHVPSNMEQQKHASTRVSVYALYTHLRDYTCASYSQRNTCGCFLVLALVLALSLGALVLALLHPLSAFSSLDYHTLVNQKAR